MQFVSLLNLLQFEVLVRFFVLFRLAGGKQSSSLLLAQLLRKDLEEKSPARPRPEPRDQAQAGPMAFPLPNPPGEAALAADLITAWKLSFSI